MIGSPFGHLTDDLPDTEAYAIIHPAGRITKGYDGPAVGVLVPSAAFAGCWIICLDVQLVKRLREDEP